MGVLLSMYGISGAPESQQAGDAMQNPLFWRMWELGIRLKNHVMNAWIDDMCSRINPRGSDLGTAMSAPGEAPETFVLSVALVRADGGDATMIAWPVCRHLQCTLYTHHLPS